MTKVRFSLEGKRCVVGAIIAFDVCLVATHAKAQELTDSIAISLKEQGDREIDAGNFAAAIEVYERGDRIQHHPIFDFNRARALQGVGRFAEALEAIEHFDRESSAELREKVPEYAAFLRQLRKSVANLILTGERRDARVSLNGRDRGKLEVDKTVRCDPGSFKLAVESEGYLPISKELTVAAGETRTVELKWQRVDERATIRLNASIPGASAWVDGHLVGQTPVELKLEVGRHRVRLEHPDAQPLQTEIVVSARESRETTLEMPRATPIWSRWWFWTGTAAVATGLVITGIALSTSKPSMRGDIAPGVVSGPLTAQ